jgi:penicillin-binding protein 1A
MPALHYINQDTEQRALAQPINAREYAPRSDIEAPFVAEIVRQEVVARFGEGAINAGYRAITTIDGRLQTAANRALRLGLIDYDRRHGYRGPVRREKLEAGTAPAQLEALLADVPPIGNLLPAVVVSVAPAAARVYLRGGGFAQIGWDGMAWTHGDAASGRADALLHRGDLVYVISDGQCAAQLGQVPGRRVRWWRSIRRTARSWRWSAASITSATPGTTSPRRAASRAPASSRSCIPAPSSTSSRRRASSWTRRS